METCFHRGLCQSHKNQSKLSDLKSSAYRYGLTEGTYQASTISLTPLGKSLIKPTSPEEEITAKQTTVLNIPVYKKIYEH
ncbi:MAG: hypothetical protein ACTSO3_07885 [Candidatus Heimdallarchaeaceae archaeon]